MTTTNGAGTGAPASVAGWNRHVLAMRSASLSAWSCPLSLRIAALQTRPEAATCAATRTSASLLRCGTAPVVAKRRAGGRCAESAGVPVRNREVCTAAVVTGSRVARRRATAQLWLGCAATVFGTAGNGRCRWRRAIGKERLPRHLALLLQPLRQALPVVRHDPFGGQQLAARQRQRQLVAQCARPTPPFRRQWLRVDAAMSSHAYAAARSRGT